MTWKARPRVRPKARQRFEFVGGASGAHGAETRGAGEKRGGFAFVDRAHGLGRGEFSAFRFDVHDLARDKMPAARSHRQFMLT